MKKRRHHYVWRHYLEAWARDGVLACYQDGRTFSTSPENVGVKKDFYRLKELSDADLWFLRETIDRADAEPLKRMNRSWVPIFVKVFEIRELLEQDTQDPEVLAQIDVLIQNAEEELHSGIEAYGIRYLGLLRDEDLEFLESPNDRAAFLHFFAVQFMRTLKGEEDVLRLTRHLSEHPSAPGKINMEAIWPVLRHILATNIGFHLFVFWDTVRCRLLRSDDPEGFITADQPIFNLAANEPPPAPPPDSVDFLYPVSPRAALRIELEHSEPGLVSESVSDLEVNWYNHRIWAQRGRQAYASSEDLLNTLAKGQGPS